MTGSQYKEFRRVLAYRPALTLAELSAERRPSRPCTPTCPASTAPAPVRSRSALIIAAGDLILPGHPRRAHRKDGRCQAPEHQAAPHPAPALPAAAPRCQDPLALPRQATEHVLLSDRCNSARSYGLQIIVQHDERIATLAQTFADRRRLEHRRCRLEREQGQVCHVARHDLQGLIERVCRRERRRRTGRSRHERDWRRRQRDC